MSIEKLDFTAPVAQIEIQGGTDNTLLWECTNPDGSPCDLTGCSGELKINVGDDPSRSIAATVVDSNHLMFEIPRTMSLPPNAYYYVYFTNAAGKLFCIRRGPMVTLREVG